MLKICAKNTMHSRFVKVGGSSRFVVIRVKILGALCNDTYALLHSQRPQKWSLLLIQYLRIPLMWRYKIRFP